MALPSQVNTRESQAFTDMGVGKTAKRVNLYDSSGNPVDLEVNDSGQLKVVLDGKVCTCNTTTTPLGAGETYTGTAGETLDYALIFVNVYSDVASATDGLVTQVSSDGVTWYDGDTYTIPAGNDKTFSLQPNRRYFRVKYTNGATPQTAFDLETIYKKTNSKPSSHRISDAIISDDDATLQKAVLTGENPSGNFVNFEATNGGNFKVSLEELENAVSVNSNTQLKVSPYCIDEYGSYAHLLGDNIFQGSLITITPEHHEIHCGDSYEATHIDTIGNGATIDFLIIVPNEPGTYPDQSQKLYHFLYEVGVEVECDIFLYESPTTTADGTAIPNYNRNRNSTLTDTLGIYYGPTVTAAGTEIEEHKAGSGRNVGGTVDRGQEWVLANNTKYLIRVTNQTTSNTYVDFNANYYVHPGV